MTGTTPGAHARRGREYAGWVVGALIVLAVLAVGAAFWFHYHP